MSKDILPGTEGSKLKKFSASWRKLSGSQKLSVFFLLFMLVSLPVAVVVSLNPLNLFSRASYPITLPITLPTTSTPRPTPRSTTSPTTPTPWGTATPVPTPVITTPTPTATSIPIWTAHPITTPTPTPAFVNSIPVISTGKLRAARVGSRYRYYVRSYDRDSSEDMKMHITNLPAGLSQGECRIDRTIAGGSSIRCPIVGRPEEPGATRVDITVFDSRGGFDQAHLTLYIRDRFNWRSILPF